MKEVIKNNIVCFLLGGIFFSCLTVYAAYQYVASEVSYTPADKNWKVESVEEAFSVPQKCAEP